jgi:pimeloyl-ACP methyl ester carboxylesterase
VFAPDLRGHGRSSRTPGDYSIRSITDDVGAFLRDIVPEPAGVFGHSLGGEVGVMAAARAPERVRALVIGDAPLVGAEARPRIERGRAQIDFQRRFAGSGMDPRDLTRLMPDLPFEGDETGRPITARDVLGDDHPEYLDWAESMLANDPSFLDALSDYDRFAEGYGLELMHDISCPTLILRAGDGALPLGEAERALELLAHGELVTLEGVGHGLHFTDPERVLDAVVPFLDRALSA